MPAVEAVYRAFRREHLFDDVSLLIRMHGFNSVIRSLGVLQRLGLDLNDAIWFQKANSASPTSTYGLGPQPTYGQLPHHYPFVVNAQSAIDLPELRSAARYDEFLFAASGRLVRGLANRAAANGKRLAVMEDGAHFVRSAQREGVEVDAIAEQTIRGGRFLEMLNLAVPTTAVYRWKPGHESPVIGFDVVEKTASRILRQGINIDQAFARPLVVGGGNLGAWTAARLQQLGYRPLIDEPRREAIDASVRLLGNTDAVIASRAEKLSAWREATCVIECVGDSVLAQFEDWPFGQDVILSEASSDNWGFDGILNGIWGTHVEWPTGVDEHRHNPSIWLRWQDHERDIRVHHPLGNALLLNCGFTINLDGGPEPIPARLMQGTRAAMIGGLAQALRPGAPRRISDLDAEITSLILRSAEADLGPLTSPATQDVFRHIETVYQSVGKELTLT